MKLNEILKQTQNNHIIYESFEKADKLLNHSGYKNIVVSISGGADSDIMIDMCERLEAKVHYIFFNTGIEYQATFEHLDYIENKYGIKIERINALVPVPLGCKKYGIPFLSKHVSEFVGGLQKHDFTWEDESYDDMLQKYPLTFAKWWHNKYRNEGFKSSQWDVDYNRYLKEFLIENPPTFQISKRCCEGAKKNVSKKYMKEHDVDLMLIGIRKAEGRIRAAKYKTCFGQQHGVDQYRPLFWYTNQDKEDYDRIFGVTHSRCYTEYGFKRTGCACCPYEKNFDAELEIIKEKEPKLYKAVNNIFGESYEYTRKYREFVAKKKQEEKEAKQSQQ